MDKLIKLIRDKKRTLINEENPLKKEVDFFKECLDTYDVNDYMTYDEITNIAYLGCVLIASGINIEEAMDYLDKMEHYINSNCHGEENLFLEYFDMLKTLNDHNMLDHNLELSSDYDESLRELYKKFKNTDLILFSLPDENRKFKYNLEASQACIDLFKIIPDPSLFSCFCELTKVLIYREEEFQKVLSKFKMRIGDDALSGNYNLEIYMITNSRIDNYIADNNFNLKKHYDLIKSYYQKIYMEFVNYNKGLERKIRKLESLEEKVKRFRPNSLINVTGDFEKLFIDSEIEYYTLLLVLNHNLGAYSVVEDQNREYNNNSITKLDILFNKYGFNFNDFTEDEKNLIIESRSIKDIEDVVAQLKYSDLCFITEYRDIFVKIIVNSNVSNIKFIDVLLKKNIISKDFILMHHQLLYDLRFFNKFFNNINYLSNLGVDLVNMGKTDSDIFLFDYNELLTQVSLLSEYKLKLDDKKLYNFDIFKDVFLLDYLDNYIELGLGQTVIDNPKYLNGDSSNIIKRIMIAKLIDLDIFNPSKRLIGMIYTGNKFYVDSDDYDKFIIDYKEDYQNPACLEVLDDSYRNTISVSTKSLPIIKKMDECFMHDSLTYVINDVIISRKRVMRNLEVLLKNISSIDISIYDLLFQAILYNMIKNVEPDKLEQIYNSICSLDLEKDKIMTKNNLI